MPLTKQQHFEAHGPKRILSLDGGGIRGVLTLEYLAVIEAMLRTRSGREDFRLCDYFDLIGGTSTGAILAAGLACGLRVAQLQDLYDSLANDVFKSSVFRKGVLAAKFPTDPLQRALEKQLGAQTTLGSDAVRTGLLVMTKRFDTGSPWPLHNHPSATYAAQDCALRLVEIVRASTAAPTYFQPEEIAISSRAGVIVQGAFVDGGVSPFNDPSLQLLMVATLAGHGFRWPTGAGNLLLISVGTGTRRQPVPTTEVLGWPPIELGVRALQSLMDDSSRVNLQIMHWLTRCVTPWVVNRALGDMQTDSANGPKLATYARYNAVLEPGWLGDTLGIKTFSDERLAEIAQMDRPANVTQLRDIGRRAAEVQITADHFPQTFDV